MPVAGYLTESFRAPSVSRTKPLPNISHCSLQLSDNLLHYILSCTARLTVRSHHINPRTVSQNISAKYYEPGASTAPCHKEVASDPGEGVKGRTEAPVVLKEANKVDSLEAMLQDHRRVLRVHLAWEESKASCTCTISLVAVIISS